MLAPTGYKRVGNFNLSREAAATICKWVEWRYGKAKEHVEHSGAVEHSISIERARFLARKMLSRDNRTTA